MDLPVLCIWNYFNFKMSLVGTISVQWYSDINMAIRSVGKRGLDKLIITQKLFINKRDYETILWWKVCNDLLKI